MVALRKPNPSLWLSMKFSLWKFKPTCLLPRTSLYLKDYWSCLLLQIALLNKCSQFCPEIFLRKVFHVKKCSLFLGLDCHGFYPWGSARPQCMEYPSTCCYVDLQVVFNYILDKNYCCLQNQEFLVAKINMNVNMPSTSIVFICFSMGTAVKCVLKLQR